MKKHIRSLVLSFSLYPLLFSFSYAGAPLKINFQGRLEESGKAAQGTKNFTFDVYDAQSGGALVWTSLSAGVAVANGVFSVVLEAGTPLNLSTATFSGPRYIEITVDGTTLSPRQEMVSAPYALVAQALSSDAVISLSNLEKDPSAPSVINTSTNALDWTQLKNVPAGLANWTGAAATFSTAAITSGKFSDDRVYITTGAFYGGFNGADQFVRLDGTGKLTALDGSALTNVNSAAMGALTSQVDNVAASTGTLTVNLAAVVLSTAPLAGYLNWNTAYGWGNHASAGYGSAATLSSVITSTGTIAANLSAETAARSGADSALSTRVDNVAASTGTLTAGLASVALSTGPLASYANWNTAYGWGNHALAGYSSAATVGSVITSTGTIAANLSAETAARSGADSALNIRVDNVAASTGTLTVNLGAETTTRSGADSALNTRVDNVAASTGTLTVNLGAETASRSGADSALNTRVDDVAASTGTLTVNLADVVLSTGPLENSGGWNSALTVAGPISLPIVTKTADYQITANDSTVLVDTSGGLADVIVTLPSAVGVPGKIYTVKNINDLYIVMVAPGGTEKLDGWSNAIPFPLADRGDFVTCQSDGANWMIIGVYSLNFISIPHLLWN